MHAGGTSCGGALCIQPRLLGPRVWGIFPGEGFLKRRGSASRCHAAMLSFAVPKTRQSFPPHALPEDYCTCPSPPASPRHRHPMRTGQDLTVPRRRRRDADRSNRSRASRCTACSCSGSCSLSMSHVHLALLPPCFASNLLSWPPHISPTYPATQTSTPACHARVPPARNTAPSTLS